MGNSCCYPRARGSGSARSLFGYRTALKEPLLQEPDKLPEGNFIVRVCIIGLDDIGTPVFKGKVDSYCELKLSSGSSSAGEQCQRSEIKTESANPRWSPPASFDFLVTKMTNMKIIFSVYHYNFIGPPLQLGDAVLKGGDITPNVTRRRLKLHTEGGPRGSIDVECQIKTPDEMAREQENVLYEFERWRPALGWGHDKKFFLPTDPGRWGTVDGRHFDHHIDNVAPPVPAGWTVKKSWHTMSTETDADGWEYGADFYTPYWYSKADGVSLMVRRRTMNREVVWRG